MFTFWHVCYQPLIIPTQKKKGCPFEMANSANSIARVYWKLYHWTLEEMVRITSLESSKTCIFYLLTPTISVSDISVYVEKPCRDHRDLQTSNRTSSSSAPPRWLHEPWGAASVLWDSLRHRVWLPTLKTTPTNDEDVQNPGVSSHHILQTLLVDLESPTHNGTD